MRLLPALLLLGLASPPALLAQAHPKGAKAQAAPKAPSPDATPPGEIHISAESQGRDKGHFWARGFVDMRSGETRLQTDSLDLYEEEKPGGGIKRRIVAEGNVVFLQGDERLAGDRLTMDADTGQGTFEKASGYVQPGVFVEADSIERVDPKTYRIKGGKFTSCSQPNPRWGMAASSATLHVDDKVTMKNALFKVYNVPILYAPWAYYPIRDDQRSTGFLLPHVGNSSLRGFDIGGAFFWAMGRSADQTFYVDHYSKTGLGFGHELRWALQSPSRGVFRSYIFEPSVDGADYDYDLDWKATQYLPGKVKASATVRWFSNTDFQQNYQDNLNLASSRNRRSNLVLQKSLRDGTLIQGVADWNDVFFGDRTRTNAHLPTLRVNQAAQQLGKSGIVLSYDARGEDLKRKIELETGEVTRDNEYWRVDGFPTLSRPFSLSFLSVDPRASYRFTRYGKSVAEDGSVTGPALDRSFFEGSIEARGPTFSRVFVSGEQPKVKHLIGPEFVYTYRTAVDEFDQIPKFDGLDQFLGTNQIEYALVNQILVKRMGPAGKLAASEFLTWRVGQTYYVQIGDNQNEFDPNYSSGAFGPGGVPRHLSPLQSRLLLRPTAQTSFAFDTEYDVNFKQLRTFTLSGTLRSQWVDIMAGWSRSKNVSEVVEEQLTVSDTLRGTARFTLVPTHLTLDGGADYNILEKELVSTRGRLRYQVQCCGFVVELIRYNFNERVENQFRFSIDLANIGSVGSFLGGDPANPSRGGGASLFQ